MQTNSTLRAACATLGLAAAISTSGYAAAQQTAESYPTRPIRLLVPYTPAGATDVIARALSQRMQDLMGQQVVVDNRPGAGGAIAAEVVARSNPDGYTLFFTTAAQVVMVPLLLPKLPYQPLRDFASITKLVESPQVLFATSKLPANTLPEFIAYAKQNPGKISYGSVGVGGSGHLGMELLKQSTGIDILHVPHKGASPASVDLIAGRLQIMFNSLPGWQGYVADGRVKILATGARKRTAAIPDIPTISEFVPGFELVTWYGVVAPKKTPSTVIARLNAEIGKIIPSAEMGKLFASLGIEAAYSTPKELDDTIRGETQRWGAVIKKAGIHTE
jgi:tripartite-type tricarboxylate transporter receptor subunit TctC